MVLKLDMKDRRILSELDMDARQPLSRLAKKVGLSREVVNYRISQLEEKKVIQGYYAVLDTAKLGFMLCRVFLKYRKIGSQKEKELLDYCNKHSNIPWVILAEGNWDLVLGILVKSLTELELVYEDINSKFGVYFQNPFISIAFRIHEFKHNYLYPQADSKELVGGAAQIVNLDSTDHALLEILAKDAKLSLVKLSQQLKTSARVINSKIKRLMANKVILAFRAKINTSLLGYDHYKVFLALQSFDDKKKSRVYSFLNSHLNVVYITKPMGPYSIEFEAIVKNTNELHNILRKFKQEFGDILINYETYFVIEVRALGYFPVETIA